MRSFILAIVVLLFWQSGIAMQATVDLHRFESEGKPFVELFFYILGSSVDSEPESGASVQITYMIGNSTGIVAGDKYNLITETSQEDFMDLRRHHLPPGEYVLTAEIVDNLDTLDVLNFRRTFAIDEPGEIPGMADVQLLSAATETLQADKWTKNNVQCIPLPFDHYADTRDRLFIYTELYRTTEALEEDFYAKFSITTESDPETELLSSYKRLSPQEVVPLLKAIDISQLSSGRYILSVGVYSQDHTMLAGNESLFTRSNPDKDEELLKNFDKYFEFSFTRNMDEDSVLFALKALAPKVSSTKITSLNDLVRKGDIENRRRFIHRYWLEEDPSAPEAAYRAYMELVAQVNVMFQGGFGHGFESDRGYIYLKYGTPDDIVSVEDEPSAPPYEIWIYYAFPVTGQSDVKFLFYSPELANSYDLLHSTCENEINNPAWEQMLYRDALTETSGGDLIDTAPVAPNFNRRAREYFNDF